MFCFIPKSIIATFFPSPEISYFSLVETIETASLFEKASNLSKFELSKTIIPFIVPLFLKIFVKALVSIPSNPKTLF